jgi:hypothetical protein
LAGGGSSARNSVCNCFQHAIPVSQNIRIPKPQNAISLRAEPTIPAKVALVFGVLIAIKFDHQAKFMRHKIDNERSDWRLSPKSNSAEAMCAKKIPKPPLGFREVAAKRLRARATKLGDWPMIGGF